MADITPSPVRQVRQFEADEAKAKSMQQVYNDEAKALEFEEQAKVEDDFDAATRQVNDARSQKLLQRMGEV